MRNTKLIRYQIQPAAAGENRALIEQVFSQLAEYAPEGLSYQAFQLADGVSFLHVLTADTETNPLAGLPAFTEFQRGFTERAASGPDVSDATLIGAYRVDVASNDALSPEA